ncbi:hypothetical protein MVQ25_07890 [Fusobacterium necrophorum]|uniref:hypothetical protein n=1 Tax=Fusobacterium necrophorum TaxID=859 RepID=UPI00254A73B8|nr:hypothetical protein [Fusobacterium necrophorum]MDK4497907.1 hypothetical protein [Fusobacterium necrophorum]
MNHKAVLESTYIATAKVYGYEKVKEKGITKNKEIVLIESLKCRVDYETITGTEQGNLGKVYQQVILFCNPDIRIPPNSKIEVTQLGRTETYLSSGKPAVYSSHQEIILQVKEVA